ncbi:MAG TPA: cysteine--tRNA ligase [Sphingomicrobium sp.]|nr:cysteine--tRNA ligase [Sphingomicrobium sp.]
MIRLHDTLSRAKREFVPEDPNRVTMYVCGPTVYGRAHIGNARPAVVFDTLARLIRYEFGADSLVYARNVTDVDDKIIAAAHAEGVEPAVITSRYERLYLEDMGALGIEPPTIAPHATCEIPAMIDLIRRLIGLGHAYEAEGHVLFSVPSDPDYGVLSKRDRDAMIAGARVEVAPYKRDPADFILWKPSLDGVIGWPSPWGRGRPGWHIECSAMIEAHLGRTIDIHGGGLDLIFPHHENEIAQSRCANDGSPLARYWVHNGFVDMGAEKMSKSLGNIVTPAELLAQGHRGETLRLALLSAHYRQPLPWTETLIAQAKATLDRLYRNAGDAEEGEVDERVLDALRDDLNTPMALARLSALYGGALKASARLLGLLNHRPEDWAKGRTRALESEDSNGEGGSGTVASEDEIDRRIAERTIAKKNRNFAEADRIRDELKGEGIILEDGPGGTTWRRE